MRSSSLKSSLRHGCPAARLLPLALCGLLLTACLASPAGASVILRDPSYGLRQVADSVNPLHPSQVEMEQSCPGMIESIGIDGATLTLYVQLSSWNTGSTCVFGIEADTGLTWLINGDTGLQINDRGTDLIYQAPTGLILTGDWGGGSGRIASIDPSTGTVGTWATLGPNFYLATLGLDFSEGVGGSAVPAGDLMLTTDEMASGIYSVAQGDTSATLHLVPPNGAGDDFVMQPDGDWIHVGDFDRGVRAYSPAPPHPQTGQSTKGVDAMFYDEGLVFVFGTRACVDDRTGELYLSYSGGEGGSGIIRVDEDLSNPTLIVEIGPMGGEGLQDMTWGPSSDGSGGTSVYFTVHDMQRDGEQVWELIIERLPICDADGPYSAECEGPRTRVQLVPHPLADAGQRCGRPPLHLQRGPHRHRHQGPVERLLQHRGRR